MSTTLSSTDTTTPTPRVGGAAAAARPPVGEWTWQPGSGAWWCSPGLLDLLALPRTSLAESRTGRRGTLSGLRLPNVHAGDRPRLRAALEAAALEGRSFAVDVRILRGDGRISETTVTGGPAPVGPAAEAEDPPTVAGLIVDVTADRSASGPDDDHDELRREIEQLRTAMASRAVIEQAKGVLMVLVGCSDQVAFELLGHLSNHTHRKVREVAGLMVASAAGDGALPEDVRQILHDACPPAAAPRTAGAAPRTAGAAPPSATSA